MMLTPLRSFATSAIKTWPTVARGLRRAAQAVGDLAFPARCAFCHCDLESSGDRIQLCDACRSQLARPLGAVCQRCASVIPQVEVDRPDCFTCRKSRLRFMRTICLSKYDSELRVSVLRVKHARAEALALALADMLVALRGDDLRLLATEVLIPVPMHWRRRLHAGTNNPELVAERLGRHLGIPVVQRSLVRCRNTPKQSGLSPNERISNVRGAFAVRRPNSVTGRRILLVDDVLTTGATCNEATRALLDAGAAEVSVATLARA